MSFSTALLKLATYRTHNTRASQDTFENGTLILKSNAASKLGDDGTSLSSVVELPHPPLHPM